MKKPQASMQIGKSGLNSKFIESLISGFKTRENIKIHVLKSAGHKKQYVKKTAEEIIDKLGNKFTYKIVGFSIFIKKWRRAKR